MKRNKTIAVIFYLCAVVCYILAAISIFTETMEGMWGMWLCLGSMWLCFGSVFLHKSQNEDDHSDSDDEPK